MNKLLCFLFYHDDPILKFPNPSFYKWKNENRKCLRCGKELRNLLEKGAGND